MKRFILTLLATAFALLMGVSAVSASSNRLDCSRNYVAYFDNTNVIKRCDFVLDLSARDHGRFLAGYCIENSSNDDITVRIKQPTQGRGDAFVSIGGVEANVELRHTYGNYYVDVEHDALLISDDFAEDRFFSTDTAVYKRTYLVTELKSPSAVACFSYEGSNAGFCFCNGVRFSENRVEKKGYVKAFNGARLVVYEIGESKQPVIEFFEDAYDGERIEGEAKLENSEQLTLREFIASFNGYEDVSEVDYYNAVMDSIRRDGSCYFVEDFILHDFTQWLCVDVPLSASEQTYVDFSLGFDYSTADAVEYACEIMTYESFIPQADVMVKTPYDIAFTNGKATDYNGEKDEYVYSFSGDFTVHIDYGRSGVSGFTIFALSFLARLVFLPMSFLIAFVITRRKNAAFM